MKRLAVTNVLLVLCLVAPVCVGAEYTWDNGGGDRDFTTAENWDPSWTTPAGDDAMVVDMTGNQSPVISSGSNIIASTLKVGSGADSGELTINGGSASFVTGITGAEEIGSSAVVTMLGGKLSTGAFTIGRSGTAIVYAQGNSSVSANTVTLGFNSAGNGSVYLENSASIDVGTFFTIGRSDVGVLDAQGSSSASANRFTLGQNATGDGSVYLKDDASIDVETFFTIGSSGSGLLSLSGNGSLRADRITMSANASGSGVMELSGNAEVSLVTFLNIGNNAGATVVINGAGTNLNLGGNLTLGKESVLEFILDGASGVGSGIAVGGNATLAGLIEVSFMDAVVNGTYTVLTAGGTITDSSTAGLLSQDMIDAGWSYAIVDTGGLRELQLTIPEPTTLSLLSLSALGLFYRGRR